MERHQSGTILHPSYLDVLFARKSQAMRVFRDILGIHDIHHFSMTGFDPSGQMLSLSSTPAIEFNVVNSGLWRHDQAYCLDWLMDSKHACWTDLYASERFDELYYLKQTKYGYASTCALSTSCDGIRYLFAFASRYQDAKESVFADQRRGELLQLGQYCMKELRPFWEEFSCQPFEISA